VVSHTQAHDRYIKMAMSFSTRQNTSLLKSQGKFDKMEIAYTTGYKFLYMYVCVYTHSHTYISYVKSVSSLSSEMSKV
jgi:hypothetical protein